MAQNRRITVEKNFTNLFENGMFHPFFDEEIENRGWKYLLHQNVEHYSQDLVVKFYNNGGFQGDEFWVTVDGQQRELTLELISNITGIPLLESDLTLQLSAYPTTYDLMLDTLIEREYNMTSKCAFQSSLRLNQLAVAQWLGHNVIGTSKPSDINKTFLHLMWIIQERKSNFCMVQFLCDTITHAKSRSAPLAVLVTQIMLHWGFQSATPLVATREFNNVGIFKECIFDHWDPTTLSAAEHDHMPTPPPSPPPLFDEAAMQAMCQPMDALRSINCGLRNMFTRQVSMEHSMGKFQQQMRTRHNEFQRMLMASQHQFQGQVLQSLDDIQEQLATLGARRARHRRNPGLSSTNPDASQ